jgi:putative peptidoglycan lipid II flippase
VHHVDAEDRRACERLAGGFLGVTLVALAIVLPVALVFTPALLGFTTPNGSGGAAAAEQERLARLLFVMFVPQVFCYAVVGIASATMNAHRRFGLAAAAPALENVGIILVLCATAVLVGTKPTRLEQTSTGELLLLGLGTTAAVTSHATLQWWGARRAGVALRPFAGWRNPEVMAVIRRALPSLGQAGLLAAQMLVLLAAANRTAGGVVGFQIAMSFVFLAIALGVTPVAVTTLPWLARLFARDERELFHDTFLRSLGLGLFVAVPASVGCALLAPLLARGVTVGQMASAAGVSMVTSSLAALAVAIVGQAVFTMCSYAFYAQKDTLSPLLAAGTQVAVCLLGSGLALLYLRGATLLVGLGAAYSAGTVAGAAFMWRRLSGRIYTGPQRLLPSLARTGLATLAMTGPVWLTAHAVSRVSPGRAGAAFAMAAALAAGLVTFVAVSSVLHAPELRWLVENFGRAKRLRGDLA